MPWTLYRYMLRELLTLLLITSLVLVFILAIAAAIKPLSDGLLGPVSMVKFISFMAPAMLSLALPFAGAFVGTMLFNRMVADNEIQVCRASGMNYLLILLPVVFLGWLLMMVMFYLSNWTIPKFCDRAEHALEKDVLSGMVNKVQRGEPIAYRKLILYADAASEGAPSPSMARGDVAPQRLIALRGVVVGQKDDEGRIRRMGSTERADLLLYHAGGESWIMLKLTSPRYFGQDERGASGEVTPLGPYLVPNPFRERLAFLSWPQLRRLKHHPEDYRHVRSAKQRVVAAMACEQLTRRLYETLTGGADDAAVKLRGLNAREEYIISAPRVTRYAGGLKLAAAAGAKVLIKRFTHGLIYDRAFEAETAVMEVTMDPSADEEPQIIVRPAKVRVLSARDESGATERPRVPPQLMRWLDPNGVGIAMPLRRQPLLDLLKVGGAEAGGGLHGDDLKGAVQHAKAQIHRLMRKSRAQFHERAALAVGCLLMVVLGAILSLKWRWRTALGVYFWTFLLAAVAVIVTRSGQQLVSVEGLPFAVGAAVTWSGNLLVCGAILTSYWSLEKN